MRQGISLRDDYSSSALRQLARRSKDADWTRRLLAISLIYDGRSRSEAADFGGVGLRIVRDWVLRFNAAGPDGLRTGKSTGKPPLLNDAQRQAVQEAIERGPTPYLDGVVRWRLVDLTQWLWQDELLPVFRTPG